MSNNQPKKQFKIGDTVCHTGYLCSGVVKDIITEGVKEPGYLIEWDGNPLKGTKIYFLARDLEEEDFKYLIKKANKPPLRELAKNFRDGQMQRPVLSSTGGKIIQQQ